MEKFKLKIDWKIALITQIVCGCFFYFEAYSLFWVFVLITLLSDMFYAYQFSRLKEEYNKRKQNENNKEHNNIDTSANS